MDRLGVDWLGVDLLGLDKVGVDLLGVDLLVYHPLSRSSAFDLGLICHGPCWHFSFPTDLRTPLFTVTGPVLCR